MLFKANPLKDERGRRQVGMELPLFWEEFLLSLFNTHSVDFRVDGVLLVAVVRDRMMASQLGASFYPVWADESNKHHNHSAAVIAEEELLF